MPPNERYRPAPIHHRLGPAFFDPVQPARFPAHTLRYRNDAWARRVGLDTLTDTEWVDHFARFAPLPGGFDPPLCLRYHGHQFRVYNPDLGDGRGFLFAQLRDADGRVLDLGTKGSGQTPYSRSGDGRLTLKGGVRELLATTMLEALGVDTSKTFSLVETGEQLYRSDEPSPTRACVLVRLSHSHIRIGTIQRLAYEQDAAAIQRLVDHVLEHYFGPASAEDLGRRPAARAAALLAETCARVARTGAAWMAAGFVHGVLNTDNINITGESFDYGPFRFLPHYDPAFTAAYFDHTGLYAYGRQPQALMWNLGRLAECLLLVADRDALMAALDVFPRTFEAALGEAICRRLGVASRGVMPDTELAAAVYGFLQAARVPFARLFFDWYGGRVAEARAARSPHAALYRDPAFQPLKEILAAYVPADPARLDHSYFAGEGPCSLLIDEVEALWSAIAAHDDWQPLRDKLAAIGVMAQALDPNTVLTG
jgi:uncharacterized protein YdiU (UPF0061 family)